MQAEDLWDIQCTLAASVGPQEGHDSTAGVQSAGGNTGTVWYCKTAAPLNASHQGT